MEYIRISAKTVDDALMEASIQFGTSSDNIEYEVVEKGKRANEKDRRLCSQETGG